MKNLPLPGLLQRAAISAASLIMPAKKKGAAALIHSPVAGQIIRKKPVRGQRNMTLRIHPKTGVVELRAPRYASRAEIESFVASHQDWLADRVAELAPEIPLKAGITLPYMGQPRLVRMDPTKKRGVRDNGTELLVGVGDAVLPSGYDPDMAAMLVEKRLKAFLVARAKQEVTMRAKYYAAKMGKRLGSVTVRDMHSRWGSCSTGARLSLSWRLILTPLFVLDYVVAHECAHTAHMDHSRAFWAQVTQLIGDYSTAEAWLEKEGQSILRIG